MLDSSDLLVLSMSGSIPFPHALFTDMFNAEISGDGIPGWVPDGDPQVPAVRLPSLELANVGSFFVGTGESSLNGWITSAPWSGLGTWEWQGFHDLFAVCEDSVAEPSRRGDGWEHARLVGTHHMSSAVCVIAHILFKDHGSGMGSIRMFPLAEYDRVSPGLGNRITEYVSSCSVAFDLFFRMIGEGRLEREKYSVSNGLQGSVWAFSPLREIVPSGFVHSLPGAVEAVSVFKGIMAAAWSEHGLAARSRVFDVQRSATGSDFISALHHDMCAFGRGGKALSGLAHFRSACYADQVRERASEWRSFSRGHAFAVFFEKDNFKDLIAPDAVGVHQMFGERGSSGDPSPDGSSQPPSSPAECGTETRDVRSTDSKNVPGADQAPAQGPASSGESPAPVFVPGKAGLLDLDRLRECGAPDHVIEHASSLYQKYSEDSFSPGTEEDRLKLLSKFPWSGSSRVPRVALSMPDARACLDRDHVGMDHVKARIMEELAVESLRGSSGRILCLLGPPGVGKSSIARSMAKAMGRAYIDVSVAGASDVHMLRGFVASWSSAEPGIVVREMIRAGSHTPLFLLDEVDKISGTAHGAAFQGALLDLLDPGRNDHFMDEFLGSGVDMSGCLFVLTANDLWGVPAPLLDRMEIIEVGGYAPEEKVQIVRERMLPSECLGAGLPEGAIIMDDPAVLALVTRYTHESGVRGLRRLVSELCRKVSVIHARCRAYGALAKPVVITVETLDQWIAQAPLSYPSVEGSVVGQIKGLAAGGGGGSVIPVECSVSMGGSPSSSVFMMTGEAGTSLSESSQAVLSVLRAGSGEFSLDPDRLSSGRVHIHLHGGRKDGPSAGLAMALSALSALKGVPLRRDVAVTGALGLDGRALAVGGLDEKILAASRAGVRLVIVPEECRIAVSRLRPQIRDRVEIAYVDSLREAWELASATNGGVVQVPLVGIASGPGAASNQKAP